ncbi:cationic amino acid transporter 3-like [Oryx dammah]|uniref:cationic amino acid transporter 3-like n=1 Tax=Oryx dammah TaxID=59534 RepID=UPI001A9B8643|nr:cationic amino acid transporter 3-like [Oryx dammah]
MLCQYVHQFGRKLVRRRPLEPQEKSESRRAPLNTLDLVILGVGKILRAAIYILIGKTVKYITGPAIVLCFLAAALFSLLSGFCYAELWARVPRSGSVYLYSYVTMGQLYAFITGWNLILSLVLGTAILARAWSYIFDSLIGNHISQALQGTFSLHMPRFLAKYPDFLALALVLLLMGLQVLGVRDSALFNKVFTGINILVQSFIILSGFIKGDLHNWQLTECDYTSNTSESRGTSRLGPLGSGGFVPFGFDGVLHGAILCFYAFVGFDTVVSRGKEALNPQWSIPLSIMFSILVCFLAYFGVSASLTLILPYYQIQPDNPLSQTFLDGGWISARYVLSVGIICAITYRLHSAMFPMSQVIYAMAEDGLLFRGLAQVRARTGAPIVAIMSSGNLAGVMALLFKLSDLVDFLSVVTLLAYTLVAFSVLVLRYQSHLKEKTGKEIEMESEAEGSPLDSVPEAGTSNILKSLWFPPSTTPTEKSGQIVYGCAFMLVLLLAILSLVLAQWPRQVFSGDPVLTTVAVLLLPLIAGVTAIIWRQPQDPSPLYFKALALPVLPLVSTFVNVYSMMRMPTGTWVLFGIWMVVGFVIYFGYGIRHSLEENNEPQPPASTLQT